MTRKKIDRVLLWLWIAAGLITIGVGLIVMGTILGCADPSFEIAALETIADTEASAEADAAPDANDSGRPTDADAGHEDSDGAAAESASDTAEVFASDAPDVDSDRGADAGDAEATADADGCTLYSHDDPMGGTSYESCIPTGVPTDGSTYSPALLAAEIAHAKSLTPWITWGSPSSITCAGESCALYSLTVDAGVAYGTWCSTGAVAGWFIETGTGGVPMCPTDLVHGEWR